VTPVIEKIFVDNTLLNISQRICEIVLITSHGITTLFFPSFLSLIPFYYLSIQGWNERNGRHLFKPKAGSFVPRTKRISFLSQCPRTFRFAYKTCVLVYFAQSTLLFACYIFFRTKEIDRYPLRGQSRHPKSVDIPVIRW
jgi:hypothetical protein